MIYFSRNLQRALSGNKVPPVFWLKHRENTLRGLNDSLKCNQFITALRGKFSAQRNKCSQTSRAAKASSRPHHSYQHYSCTPRRGHSKPLCKCILRHHVRNQCCWCEKSWIEIARELHRKCTRISFMQIHSWQQNLICNISFLNKKTPPKLARKQKHRCLDFLRHQVKLK